MKPIRISNKKIRTIDIGSKLYHKGWICEVIAIDYLRNKIEISKLFQFKKKHNMMIGDKLDHD